MNPEQPFKIHCNYYERNDWLKVDVLGLLAPWVNRVAAIYGIKKTPAKHLVTYALSMIAAPYAQEIIDTALAIFEEPETFQSRYGTRLGTIPPETDLLVNADEAVPADPRQVNFMDLVDYWAKPINRTFGVGIVQCRDVVKITLSFFLFDHGPQLCDAIQLLVQNPDHEFFSGVGRINFPELELTVAE